jgi:ADP-heptose:LPS heptosyltransferase
MTEHAVIARMDNAGDVLLAGPAVRAVAAEARTVTLLCGPHGRAAAELLPGVDAVEEFCAPWIDPEPEPVDPDAVDSLRERLRRLAPDQLIVLSSHNQSALPLALVARLAGIPVVAAISPEYPGSLLDIRHRVDDGLHEVERGLSLVGTLGYRLPDGDDGALRVAGVQAHLATRPSVPYVVVHPGASVPARTWQPGRFAELVDRLAGDGIPVFVTGTADEAHTASVVAGRPRPGVVDLAGRTTLRQLGSVLAQARVVVTGNTGPAHLAAAVGTPVVSIFPPTVPAERWRPWGVPCVVLGNQDIACRGCRARTCPVPGHPCVGEVTVNAVLEAIRLLSPALQSSRRAS